MAGIERQKSVIFAGEAPQRLVTAFKTTEDDTPIKTKTPNVIQNENYQQGWINDDNSGNVEPYAEDMNGVLYTLSYNTAYLYEKGIPEYAADQTYQQYSFCTYQGYIYRCKADSTLNVLPTNTAYWDKIETDAYSATNIGTTGASVYAGSVGTQFQFKKIQGSGDVTITEGDDYININATGGGGSASFTANSPLSYNNGVLSIQAATTSQAGYLSAADWTSFNSKLSSTVFSTENTWTDKNYFPNVILKNGSTTSIGFETLYSNLAALRMGSGSLFSMLGQADTSVVGFFPTWTKAAATNYCLGWFDAIWDYGIIDNIWSKYLVSKYTDASNSYFNIQYADSARNGTTFAYLGSYGGILGFFPSTSETGSLGSASKIWNEAYIKTIQTSGITTTTDNTYEIGATGARFKNIWSRNVYHSDNVHTYSQGYNYGIEWYNNTSSASRTVIGANDSFYPYNDGTIDLGGDTNRWRLFYARAIYLNAGTNYGLYFGSDTSHTYVKDVSANTLILNATGTVQISVGGTSQYIASNSDFRPNVNATSTSTGRALGTSSYKWQQLYAFASTINTSDRRAKDNIEDLIGALEKLNSMDVYSYTMGGIDKHINYGFIAQNELERNPELVYVPDDYSEDEDGGQLGVVESNVLFLAVKAIQELSQKVDSLEQKLKENQR